MKRRHVFFAVLAVLALATLGGALPKQATSTTAVRVDNLGTPFTKGLYARNVWDMQLYDNRIFLGHGNSSNSGPDTNAGPITIWSFDLATQQFVAEYQTNEEQVDIFRVIDGTLYTPGHDPREGSEFGNYYRLDAAGWQKIRTVPNVLHTYDIIRHEGKLFTANGTLQKNTLQVSEDGATWRSAFDMDGRSYEIFVWKHELYAMRWILSNNTASESAILRYNDASGKFENIMVEGRLIIPGRPNNSYSRTVRTTEFAGQLVYIGSDYGVNDHQWRPFGLYVAPTWETARKVALPEAAALPYDVLMRGDTLYVTAAFKRSAAEYTNVVYKTKDLNSWSEVLRFDAVTFARSFEEVGGVFYFGLGSEETLPLSPATGTILRVTLNNVAPPLSPTNTRSPTSQSSAVPPSKTPVPTPTRTPVATIFPPPGKPLLPKVFLPIVASRR